MNQPFEIGVNVDTQVPGGSKISVAFNRSDTGFFGGPKPNNSSGPSDHCKHYLFVGFCMHPYVMLCAVGVQLFQLFPSAPLSKLGNLVFFSLLSTSNNTLLPDEGAGILPPFSNYTKA